MVTDSKGTEELISFIILPMTDRQTVYSLKYRQIYKEV